MEKNDFDKTKIYENLNYLIEPINYKSKIPWIVQQQIAATNGIHYIDRIGKLNDYPNFELPIRKVSNGIMLDIGIVWVRWLVSGFKKGFIPIGIDIRLEFCKTAINTLHEKILFRSVQKRVFLSVFFFFVRFSHHASLFFQTFAQ